MFFFIIEVPPFFHLVVDQPPPPPHPSSNPLNLSYFYSVCVCVLLREQSWRCVEASASICCPQRAPHPLYTCLRVCVKILHSVMKSAAWLDLASPEGPTRAIAHLAREFFSPRSTAKVEIVLRITNIFQILVDGPCKVLSLCNQY